MDNALPPVPSLAVILKFKLYNSRGKGKTLLRFALGGLRIDSQHLQHHLVGYRNSDPAIFVVPKFGHTIMSEWVLRQLNVSCQTQTITISVGGKPHPEQVDCANVTYYLVDEVGKVSNQLAGDVCFSDSIMRRLKDHFSKQIPDDLRDYLEEASGIVSWEHLESHGLNPPGIDPSGEFAVIRKKR